MPSSKTYIGLGILGYISYLVILMTQTLGTSEEAFDTRLFSNPLLLITINTLFYLSLVLILWGVIKLL